MHKVMFDKELMYDILNEEQDGSTIIEDKIIGTSRWSIKHEFIFKLKDKFYLTQYQVGATESRDELPWEYEDKIECIEVSPVEKIITTYKPIK
jgi:hypothetical protein